MLAEEIESKALQLSTVKRIHLVETLLDSLDETDAKIEKVWVKESENRYNAYKMGDIEGIPLDQIRTRIER